MNNNEIIVFLRRGVRLIRLNLACYLKGVGKKLAPGPIRKREIKTCWEGIVVVVVAVGGVHGNGVHRNRLIGKFDKSFIG